MEKVISRLLKYMEEHQLNDNQVTNDCHLSVGLIGQAKKGKSDLGKRSIDKILSTYVDISPSWLMTGEGPMLRPTTGNGNVQQVAQGNGNVQQVGTTTSSAEAVLAERVKSLEALLNERERLIKVLMERK